ncbi:MAG TPA: dihydropteroate synthase [Hydrogenispora sp.]|jgi:dihydropteroate synthase|nr:dihydropteroate synthase [Hydrogenispora sp.]
MAFSLRLLSANQPDVVWKEMNRIGVSPEGLDLMIGKGEFLIVKVANISAPAANILKQEMLAKGGEVALGKEMAYLRSEEGEAIIMGTRTQYRRLLELLPRQPFGLAALAQDLNRLLETLEEGPPPLTIKNQRFEWGKRTYIMGIINITPDSFSGDGLLAQDRMLNKVLQQAEAFLEAGADFLDIGGQSTRPGYTQVSTEEEKRRVLPVLETLAKKFPLPLSVDTYKPAVAKAALAAGADLINDIWGLQNDPAMVQIAAAAQAPVIVMHNKTTPEYTDLMGEVASFLQNSIDLAVAHGLPREKIIIDPGIGFGKTPEQNLTVLNRLDELKALGAPILLGTSRKSVIGHVLDLPVEQRVEGTAATVAVGITRGAHIIRVHDVKAMVRVARMTDAIIRS